MRNLTRAAAAAVLCAGLAACTVEQPEEGRPPEVEPADAPAFEVQPADVDLEWDTTTVRVPDVDLTPDGDTTPGGTAPDGLPR
jgi:hypothetical protein